MLLKQLYGPKLEPVISVLVHIPVIVTKLLWRLPFLLRLSLRRCTVFVRSTDVQRLSVLGPYIPRVT
jgi:hypothetical protein